MIPSILWQTAKSELDLHPFTRHIKSWKLNNPALDMRFMDDDMCKNFIRDNFSDEVFFVYTALPLGIMRADMWRLAVVYINGGIYADTDALALKDINDILQNRSIVLCQEHNNSNSVSNFFFAAEPKHPVLKEAIDIMVKNFAIAFDKNSQMLVQNFGMDSLQKACDIHNIELVPKNEIEKYVLHSCHGSWRNEEQQYKNTMNNKPITFFTTFNQSGYSLYGATWIQTFIKNVAVKGANIKAKIYTHGFKLNIKHPQIELIDYDEAFPHHNKWKEEFNSKSDKSNYVKSMTIRFSHKGFVISHALENIKDGYAIWLDGDCVMHNEDYLEFPSSLLNDSSVACQVENTGNDCNHVESGVLLFDMNNADIEKFKTEFAKNYSIDEVLKMSEAYDGFIVYKSLLNSKIKFNNLNEVYGIGGVQSCPTLTFLHPEIKKRFTHNIGPGGKSNYTNWETVKYTDSVFLQISNMMPVSEKDNKILALKRKRALLKTL